MAGMERQRDELVVSGALFAVAGATRVVDEAVAGRITGYTKHGLNQAMSQDGVGVSSRVILNAVKNPLKMIGQAAGKIKYIGEDAIVILNKAGEVVTIWAWNAEAGGLGHEQKPS